MLGAWDDSRTGVFRAGVALLMWRSRPLAAIAVGIPPIVPPSIDAAAAERRDEGRVAGGVGVGRMKDRMERRDPVGLGRGGDTLISVAGEAWVLIGRAG